MTGIYKAIANIMKELEAVGKHGVAPREQGGYGYRKLEDIYNHVQKLMAKHEVFSAPEVINRVYTERKSASNKTLYHAVLTVKYKFYTSDGSSVDVTVDGEGLDSGDKRSNKALSGAHKYALVQLFCLPTEDIADPDKEHAEDDKSAESPYVGKPFALTDVNDDNVVSVGKHTGKTFAQLLASDKQHGMQYAQWISKQEKPHKSLADYLNYVKALGAL